MGQGPLDICLSPQPRPGLLPAPPGSGSTSLGKQPRGLPAPCSNPLALPPVLRTPDVSPCSCQGCLSTQEGRTGLGRGGGAGHGLGALSVPGWAAPLGGRRDDRIGDHRARTRGDLGHSPAPAPLLSTGTGAWVLPKFSSGGVHEFQECLGGSSSGCSWGCESRGGSAHVPGGLWAGALREAEASSSDRTVAVPQLSFPEKTAGLRAVGKTLPGAQAAFASFAGNRTQLGARGPQEGGRSTQKHNWGTQGLYACSATARNWQLAGPRKRGGEWGFHPWLGSGTCTVGARRLFSLSEARTLHVPSSWHEATRSQGLSGGRPGASSPRSPCGPRGGLGPSLQHHPWACPGARASEESLCQGILEPGRL